MKKSLDFKIFLLFLAMTSNLFAIEVSHDHKIYRLPLGSLGVEIFEAILSKIPDQLLDRAAQSAKTPDDVLGVIQINADRDGVSSSDLVFDEYYDLADYIKPKNSSFAIKSAKIIFYGKGITTHGIFFSEANPGSYQEEISLDQLPYASLSTANTILQRNELFVARKSQVINKCEFFSITKNQVNDRFLLQGIVEVKLYLMGHSYVALEHDIEIELCEKNKSNL